MIPLRLVVDTNIVVSAALKPEGLQRIVFLLAITKPARLYVSAANDPRRRAAQTVCFEVLTALKPQLIIPMHFFNQYALARFLDRARAQWDVAQAEIPSVVVSKATLPTRPQVLVLPGH